MTRTFLITFFRKCAPSRCMRLLKDTRPMWPGIRGWMERAQVPQPVNRRPPASPWGTSLEFTRQQHSLPLLVVQMAKLITLRTPRRTGTVTLMRWNLLLRRMRDCTSPVTSRKLYRMTLFCRSRWPMPCEFRR